MSESSKYVRRVIGTANGPAEVGVNTEKDHRQSAIERGQRFHEIIHVGG